MFKPIVIATGLAVTAVSAATTTHFVNSALDRPYLESAFNRPLAQSRTGADHASVGVPRADIPWPAIIEAGPKIEGSLTVEPEAPAALRSSLSAIPGAPALASATVYPAAKLPEPASEARPPLTPATAPVPPVPSPQPIARPLPPPSDLKPRPAMTAPHDAGHMVVKVEPHDVLNVRSGPSSGHDVVGGLQPNTRGIAITGGCRANWCPVQHEAMTGWVNRAYLAPLPIAQNARITTSDRPRDDLLAVDADRPPAGIYADPPYAQRTCLSDAARALLERIEKKFGPVKLVSTCRPGAMIAGTARRSHHATGNAVDFNAGERKGKIIAWLIDNHHQGGTMTYPNMDHIHVDIGPHFVSIAGGQRWASWRNSRHDFPGRMAVGGKRI